MCLYITKLQSNSMHKNSFFDSEVVTADIQTAKVTLINALLQFSVGNAQKINNIFSKIFHTNFVLQHDWASYIQWMSIKFCLIWKNKQFFNMQVLNKFIPRQWSNPVEKWWVVFCFPVITNLFPVFITKHFHSSTNFKTQGVDSDISWSSV